VLLFDSRAQAHVEECGGPARAHDVPVCTCGQAMLPSGREDRRANCSCGPACGCTSCASVAAGRDRTIGATYLEAGSSIVVNKRLVSKYVPKMHHAMRDLVV
jgi:hypothetical protein